MAESTTPPAEAKPTEQVTAIKIETAVPDKVTIRSKDARQQILVTGEVADGRPAGCDS
ncbi:MAG: hypothetical protein R3C11_24050 [Planctomycetaceae bacterium]